MKHWTSIPEYSRKLARLQGENKSLIKIAMTLNSYDEFIDFLYKEKGIKI